MLCLDQSHSTHPRNLEAALTLYVLSVTCTEATSQSQPPQMVMLSFFKTSRPHGSASLGCSSQVTWPSDTTGYDCVAGEVILEMAS